MRTPVAVIAAAALLAACSGSPTVASVNGEPISADDVYALRAAPPEGAVIAGDPFRRDLNLLIVNIALRTAAEEQYGLEGLDDADRLAARIADPPEQERAVFAGIGSNPELGEAYARGAAEYFLLRESVLGELAVDGLGQPETDALFNAWANAAVEAAEVVISSRVGIWGGRDGVLPPP